MVSFSLATAATAALLPFLVTAQTCQESSANNENNCGLGALPQDGTTVYYDPTDSGNIEFFGQSVSQCATGSQATITFYTGFDPYTGSQLASCGCLPLDGNQYVLDCGIPKGTIPEGGYHFQIEENSQTLAFVRFNIVHHQVTSSVAGPTTTVQSTTYESTTVTVTDTETDTATTTPVATATTPAATDDQTSTVTPVPVTKTITKTKTKTKTDETLIIDVHTKTVTAKCKKPTPKPCPFVKKKPHHPRALLEGRQQNGYTVTGDGPPTTTVTGSAYVVTQTVDGGTTTDTDTESVTTTTTVTAPTSTTTVAAGTTTDSFTVTLAPVTSTITKHTRTTKTVHSSCTLDITFFQTTTPTCRPTGHPRKH